MGGFIDINHPFFLFILSLTFPDYHFACGIRILSLLHLIPVFHTEKQKDQYLPPGHSLNQVKHLIHTVGLTSFSSRLHGQMAFHNRTSTDPYPACIAQYASPNNLHFHPVH